MTKDEMKNKISMALKDPILQQGFEIICKENAELEAENAKLKRYAKQLQNICKEGLEMVEDIENRLLEINPQEWVEIEKMKG